MTFAEQMKNYARGLEKSPEEQIDDRKQKHLKAGKSMAEAERLAKWELDLAAMVAEDDESPAEFDGDFDDGRDFTPPYEP